MIKKRVLSLIIVACAFLSLPVLTVIFGRTIMASNETNITLPKHVLKVVVYPYAIYQDVEKPLVKIGITTLNVPNIFGKPVGDQCIWYGFTEPDSTYGNNAYSVTVVLPEGEYIVWVAYECQLVYLNQTKTIWFTM